MAGLRANIFVSLLIRRLLFDWEAELYRLTKNQESLQQRARELSNTHVKDRAAEVDRTEEYPWDTVHAKGELCYL